GTWASMISISLLEGNGPGDRRARGLAGWRPVAATASRRQRHLGRRPQAAVLDRLEVVPAAPDRLDGCLLEAVARLVLRVHDDRVDGQEAGLGPVLLAHLLLQLPHQACGDRPPRLGAVRLV